MRSKARRFGFTDALLRLIPMTLCGYAALVACSGDDGGVRKPVVIPGPDNVAGDRDASKALGDASADTSVSSASDASADGGGTARDGGDAGGSDDAGPGPNCGDKYCEGTASCNAAGSDCECPYGYAVVETSPSHFQCEVDRGCVKVRFLEDGCRVQLGGANAVGMFFAVDYCNGMAVLPQDLGDLTRAFSISEDGTNIEENPESYATVIERDVESFVGITLDVSSSLTPELIGPLTQHVADFVQSLESGPGEPPVTVELSIFGRQVVEVVPFTRDLSKITTALADVATAAQAAWDNIPAGQLRPTDIDLTAYGAPRVRIDGTALHTAVNRGVKSVERMRRLRAAVTDDGVLTSGTLVAITDGKDASEALDTAFLSKVLSNVISVGVSADIDRDDLAAIGRDGTFIAPSAQEWPGVFAEISTRVDQYPDRAYLLAYCSSAVDGQHDVSVGLNVQGDVSAATCRFNAEWFSKAPDAPACTPAFLTSYCDGAECGGLLACGACADDGCCSRTTCYQPSNDPVNCMGQDALCARTGDVCLFQGTYNQSAGILCDPRGGTECWACGPPLAIGEPCDGKKTKCEPGVAYCGISADSGTQKVCIPVSQDLGSDCGDAQNHPAEECSTLNCAAINPDYLQDGYQCGPPARMYDACSGQAANSVCESGASCQGGVCKHRKTTFPRQCTQHSECLFGYCPTSTRLCTNTPYCPFSWSDKI